MTPREVSPRGMCAPKRGVHGAWREEGVAFGDKAGGWRGKGRGWRGSGGLGAASGWLQSFACRSLIDRSSSERSLASVLQPRLRERLDRTCCARQTGEPSTFRHLNIVSDALALTYIPQTQCLSDY